MENREIIAKIVRDIEKAVAARMAPGREIDAVAIVNGEQAEGFAQRTVADALGKERDPEQEKAILAEAYLPVRRLIVQQLEGMSLKSMLRQLRVSNEFLNDLTKAEEFNQVVDDITPENFNDDRVLQLLELSLQLRKRSVDLKLADVMNSEEKRHLNSLRRNIQLLQCLSQREIEIGDINPGPFSGEMRESILMENGREQETGMNMVA